MVTLLGGYYIKTVIERASDRRCKVCSTHCASHRRPQDVPFPWKVGGLSLKVYLKRQTKRTIVLAKEPDSIFNNITVIDFKHASI